MIRLLEMDINHGLPVWFERYGMENQVKVISNIEGNILNKCTLDNFEYQVDPYIGCEHNCYYCYVLNQAKTDWTREVLGYQDIKERLGAELSGIPPQIIYMGWQTDPYQPCEQDCKQTRQVLELLLDRGFSASILTKSDLVLRDMDLLRQMPDAAVSVSVAFSDDNIRRLFEYHTMDTGKRISALAELRPAGVGTSALICPIIPYITDAMDLVNKLEPHTEKIWLYGLSILDDSEVNWQNIKRILEHNFPELSGKVEDVVFAKDHPYWLELRERLNALGDERPIDLSIHV
jgi:DNA repair photolyase